MDKTTGMAAYFHFGPSLIYGVTDEELQLLERNGGNYWKDIFLMAFPLTIGLIFNGLALTGDPRSYNFYNIIRESLKWPILLNYGFGLLFLAIAIISGIAWCASGNEFKRNIERIRNKPLRYKMDYVPSSDSAQTIVLTSPEN